jgi:hypothetical protein
MIAYEPYQASLMLKFHVVLLPLINYFCSQDIQIVRTQTPERARPCPICQPIQGNAMIKTPIVVLILILIQISYINTSRHTSCFSDATSLHLGGLWVRIKSFTTLLTASARLSLTTTAASLLIHHTHVKATTTFNTSRCGVVWYSLLTTYVICLCLSAVL